MKSKEVLYELLLCISFLLAKWDYLELQLLFKYIK